MTAPEKPGKPPRTLEENLDTPLTIEAANAEPGIFGIESGGGAPAEDVVGIPAGLTVEAAGLGTAGS